MTYVPTCAKFFLLFISGIIPFISLSFYRNSRTFFYISRETWPSVACVLLIFHIFASHFQHTRKIVIFRLFFCISVGFFYSILRLFFTRQCERCSRACCFKLNLSNGTKNEQTNWVKGRDWEWTPLMHAYHMLSTSWWCLRLTVKIRHTPHIHTII